MLRSVWRVLHRFPRLETLSSLAAYERWAVQYPPYPHNALMQTEETAMRQLSPPLIGKTVLDLACGSGRYGLIAQAAGASVALGLDNSPHMLQRNPMTLRALATTENIPLASATIDVVLCGLALGHVKDLETSLMEIGRVLRRDGCALVSDFHPFIFMRGQQRTFTTADGHAYAVEHYPHLYADYHAAAHHAGLRIDAVMEPYLEQTQAAHMTTQPPVPVIIAYRFVKT